MCVSYGNNISFQTMYQKILNIYNSIKSINAKIKDNLRTFEPNNKKN